MRGGIEELEATKGGHGHRAQHGLEQPATAEEGEDQAGLQEGRQHQRVAEAEHAATEHPEGRRVEQVHVAGVAGLDLAVEDLAIEDPLGHVGEGPLVGRNPEAGVEADDEEEVGAQGEEGGQPQRDLRDPGRGWGLVHRFEVTESAPRRGSAGRSYGLHDRLRITSITCADARSRT